MKVDKFIKDYDMAVKSKKDINAFLNKRKTTDYISYAEKMSEAKKIIDFTSYITEKDGNKRFSQNSPMRYFLFVLLLLRSYTDIEIDNEKSVQEFDLINKRRLIPKFVELIGEEEYTEYQTVLNMVLDDEMENFRSLAGYIDNKVDLFNTLLSAIEQNQPEEVIK